MNQDKMNGKEISFIPLTPPHKSRKKSSSAQVLHLDEDDVVPEIFDAEDVSPWTKLRNKYDDGAIGLHQEIEDFYK